MAELNSLNPPKHSCKMAKQGGGGESPVNESDTNSIDLFSGAVVIDAGSLLPIASCWSDGEEERNPIYSGNSISTQAA